MFKWLKNIFYKLLRMVKPLSRKQSRDMVDVDPLLDEKIKEVLEQKERISNTGCDWYTIHTPTPDPPRTIHVFTGVEIKTDTLAELKRKRIKREERKRIEQEEQSARAELAKAKQSIEAENVDAAKEALDNAYCHISIAKNQELHNEHKHLRERLACLRETLRQREIARQEEERKAQERKRNEEKEKEERRRRTLLEQERQNEQRRRERSQRFEAELLSMANREREERERLAALGVGNTSEVAAIQQLLRQNNIKYFYHFTPRVNLQSIRNHGGLYSWKYCEEHNWKIPFPGGDETSRGLDRRHGLEDYVRLSFCDDHPMAYRLRDKNLVLLKIKVDVAWLQGTLFSDINAASNSHTHAQGLAGLNRVDFRAVKRHRVGRTDLDFGPHQAEVLVKTHIPSKYIINLDNPTEIFFD